MSERYFAQVVKVVDSYEIVINKGSSDGVKLGDCFLIVGIGEVIVDPETGLELEKLEIVRGKVQSTHIQEKISTLRAYEIQKSPDKKEIKKVISSGSGGTGLSAVFGNTNTTTTTENITPGGERLIPLEKVEVKDFVIRIVK